MIVLDANILIRAVLGRRVRQLIDTYAGQGVRFFAPDVAFDDAEKYLPPLLKKRGKPDADLSASLELTEHESLHIYRNGLILYLQRDSKEKVVSAIEVVCRLAEQFPGLDDSLDLSGLPAKFENLFGLISKWALSDDEKRSEMLEETSLEALQSFAATVSPYIPAIDEYLDSFGDEPPPQAAVALGTLAKCCVEVQIRIRDTQEK
jgi:hypothetical protein